MPLLRIGRSGPKISILLPCDPALATYLALSQPAVPACPRRCRILLPLPRSARKSDTRVTSWSPRQSRLLHYWVRPYFGLAFAKTTYF
jgi:hypothetical protein